MRNKDTILLENAYEELLKKGQFQPAGVKTKQEHDKDLQKQHFIKKSLITNYYELRSIPQNQLYRIDEILNNIKEMPDEKFTPEVVEKLTNELKELDISIRRKEEEKTEPRLGGWDYSEPDYSDSGSAYDGD